MFLLTLRLQGGTEVDAGSFDEPAAAHARAKELIEAAEAGRWLTLDDRYIRPSALISIDVREGRGPTWRGGETRARWAGPDDDS